MKLVHCLIKIKKMTAYANDALIYFSNSHIINEIDYILINGTEGDKQITAYDISGLDGLKKYLMDNVEYQII